MGDEGEDKEAISVLQSLVDSCLNPRVAGGGLKEHLYMLPDARFETARESLMKVLRNFLSFKLNAD